MTYRLARAAGANDTILWLSKPDVDLLELGAAVSLADVRTLRAALDHGRASPEYSAALALQVTAEAALVTALALVDPTIESTLAVDNVLKCDSEYLVVRFVNQDSVEVGRAGFGSARAAHVEAAEVFKVRLSVEAQVDVELIVEGSPLAPGDKGDVRMPFDGRISSVRLMADATGDVVFDVLKAAFPTVPTASITDSNKPTLAGARTYEDATLSGWTTAFVVGDVLRFVVLSSTGLTRVTVALTCTSAV